MASLRDVTIREGAQMPGREYAVAWLADALFGRRRSDGRYAPARTSVVEDLVLRVGLLAVVVALLADVLRGR